MGRTDGGCLLWWHTGEVFKKLDIVVYDENYWEYEEYNMQLCGKETGIRGDITGQYYLRAMYYNNVVYYGPSGYSN